MVTVNKTKMPKNGCFRNPYPMNVKTGHGKSFLYCFLILFCFSCTGESENNDTVFLRVLDKETGIDFSNDLPLDAELNVLNYIYYFNGGGVAAGDINNDGLVDLFFTGNQVSNEMYLNQGGFNFKKITRDAGLSSTGWSSGATMVDINADGWLDIYVCRSGSPNPTERKNLLYINQKDGTFKEEANEYGLADESYTTHAAFFDYDMDGDLDLYLLNHMHRMEDLNTPKRKNVDGESDNTDKLFRNNGVGPNGHPSFTDVSQEAGITIEGYGLGVGISDIDQDGFPDIYVSNDFVSNDILYMNQGNGTFINKIDAFISHQSHNGMGNDLADINNDGLTDILVMDMLPATNERRKKMLNKPSYDFFSYGQQMGYEPQYMRNTLQLNQGSLNGTTYFGEIGQFSGISSTDWSWAGLFSDYDLDGEKDLYITNGYLKDMTDLDFIVYRKRHSKFRTRQQADSLYLASVIRLPEVALQNYFYKNNGDLTFENVSKDWAPKSPGFSNGAVYADLDNDGDLDIITNNINEKATILKNTTSDNGIIDKNYLTLKFKGPKDNPLGIGTKVWTYSNGNVQFSENYTSRGFQSSVPPYLNFGFKGKSVLDSLKVRWPDGKSEMLAEVRLDTVRYLSYKNARQELDIEIVNANYLFEKADDAGITLKHGELDFSDYRIEPLLPRKFSNDGPSIAVADVNGDNLDDFFVGASYNFSGQLYTQLPNGRFKSQNWNMDKEHEDMGSLFFDADNDGDNDLYIVSGSNEFAHNKANYQDRLYFNNGHGKFSREENALPEIRSSGSCVVAADYDKDGQLDLFVGSRVVAGNYGLAPKSYLLKNNGGKFKDVIKHVIGEEFLGMVTAALWTDVDNDGWLDLMVVGEWMPITIYKNNKGDLSEKVVLESSSGWWNSINGGDFDNDGDIDYIVGNLGENSVYKASSEYPMELYLGDFDKDGRNDPIMTTYSLDDDGVKRSYPFASRDLLADQMILVKNKFKYYKDYATARISDIISEEQMTSTKKLTCDYLQSAYIENLGNGKFAIHSLPFQAQLSPVLGTTISDYDLDGNLDVLLVGNFYHAEVGYGQLDASTGLLLRGNGKGGFTASDFTESGFLVNGDARSLARLSTLKGSLVLAARNNDSLITYRYKEDGAKRIVRPANADHAILDMADGRKQKIEFYRGEGYLSQSSRSIWISNNATITWSEESTEH